MRVNAAATSSGGAGGTSAEPLFVVGAPRSGTTLLRYVLDAHESFACPPETKFIPALRDALARSQVGPALRSLGLSEREVDRHARRFVAGILDAYAERRGKRRWADKTPNNAFALDFIDRVFTEEPLYCFVVRHPFDAVQSMDESFSHGPSPDPDVARFVAEHGRTKTGFARLWDDVNRRLLAFAAGRERRVHRVRYEDVVADPRATLSALFAFLGEPFDPDLAQRALAMPHDPGYGDDKIATTREIRRDRVGTWRRAWSHADVVRVTPIVAETAAALGYALDERS